jgi:hypothetical protein
MSAAHKSTPVPGGRSHHVESARRQWPPVVATHVGCPPPPLTTALDVTEEVISHFAFPSHHSAALLAALLRAVCCFIRHCPSPMSRQELSDRAKMSASSPCPSCTKSLAAAPASEAGHGISKSSSSFVSTSSVVALSDCPPPPTPPTLQ